MKRIKILMLIITIILLSFIVTPAYANDYSCEIKLYYNGKTELAQGEKTEIDISIEDITLNDGIALYNGMLEYNSDKVGVEVIGNEDWELYYQKDNNITLSRKDLENSKEDAIIGKIILTAKTDIEIDSDIIKLVKNEVTDGETCNSIKDSMFIGVKYSTTEITNEDVIVKITSSTELRELSGWTLSEDKKSLTKEYAHNETEEVTIADAEGEEIKIKISVLNIDKVSPSVTGVEDGAEYTKFVEPNVTDDNLDTVELIKDGTKVEGYTNGGKIQQEGQYEIRATDRAGNITTVRFTIKYQEEFELDLGEYEEKSEEGEYLVNILPDTTKENLINNIDTNGEVLIYKGEELVSESDAYIATGMKLKILSKGEVVKEYTLVVTGDLNGDGQMGDIDLLRMARYIVGLDKNLDKEYLKASDVYKDSIYADNKDLLKMARILVGLDKF